MTEGIGWGSLWRKRMAGSGKLMKERRRKPGISAPLRCFGDNKSEDQNDQSKTPELSYLLISAEFVSSIVQGAY